MSALLQCVSLRMSDKAIVAYFADTPVKPAFRQINVQGRVVHYAQIGDSTLPLVVFIHGSPGSWDAFIGFFTDSTLYQKARLVSVDRLGFGKSGLGLPEKSLRQQAAAIAAVIETVQPGGRAILVGHSLGGPVAARLAMDFPRRVRGLILVAPSIDPSLEKKEWFRPVLSAFPVRQLLPAEFDVSNQEISPLRGELEQMLPHWAELQIPVTVIQGDKDNLVSPANAAFAQRMLPHNPPTLRIISGMNHFIPWRRPDLIHEAILQQLP